MGGAGRKVSIHVLERFDPDSAARVSDYTTGEGFGGNNARSKGVPRLYHQLGREG